MSIILEQLLKHYESHPVVNNVSLEIADGEFFVLLGPSGSGKSTILRMIAGLTSIEYGRVLLHNRDVTYLSPQERGVGFVFQNYALFRHMSVADNVEFGLKIRKVPRDERKRRRDQLLELAGLAGLGARMPNQLSGGQQQRVALARALAYQPEVLLLDEPFGALDAKIRSELRSTLRSIQRELGTTTIFVTHDQEEAFELADRIGVMNAGRLLECGPPIELYQRPQTEFVATFLGTANLLVGRYSDEAVHLGDATFPLGTEAYSKSDTRSVQVLFRPEDIALAPTVEELHEVPLGLAEVETTTFVGSFERLRLRIPPITGVRPIAPQVPFGQAHVLIEATRSQDLVRRFPLNAGDSVWVGVKRIHVLAHPGMSFLVLCDGTSSTQATLDLGGQLARLAHARTSLLGYAPVLQQFAEQTSLQQQLQATREQIGAGLPFIETRVATDPADVALPRELARHPYDLVFVSSKYQDLAEMLVQFGKHHVMLVPQAPHLVRNILICVAAGEPGKDDVSFTGRIARHLGATVTLLSVIPEGVDDPLAAQRAERFLEAGVRTLAVLGVEASTLVRKGVVRDEILAEAKSQEYQLLVLGAPITNVGGQQVLAGLVGQVLGENTDLPVLIVRSPHTANRAPWIGANGRMVLPEEKLR